ncbi:ABC transporter permease [Luteimicrobium sp. DT211]|uniref:ABC transporter permease n=1 Tax=Luteimicrobium sp. DT211 TaxID=3393412 RepID=UPI003CF395BC
MFLALRDLRHARGRFTLMTVVLVLVTVLVTFLSALTAGLARASTSAVTDLPADRLAFAEPAGAALSFTGSQVTPEQWRGWGGREGVRRAEPLGVATVRASASGSGSTTQAVTAFGVEPGSALVPDGRGDAVRDGTAVVSRGAASDLGVRAGDVLDVQGVSLHVGAVTAEDADFSHTPVVWVDLGTWQSYGAHGTAAAGAEGGDVATAVALWTGDDGAALAAADEALGTRTVTLTDARSAVGSFTAENLSLTVMQAFLLAISALVVGAFFTVWTMNRAGDLAVVKALGGASSLLVRDALGQAFVVLLVGVGVGTGMAAGGAALARGAVPVVLDASTFLVPAALLVGLGLVGAAASVWRIARIDPHAALQAR